MVYFFHLSFIHFFLKKKKKEKRVFRCPWIPKKFFFSPQTDKVIVISRPNCTTHKDKVWRLKEEEIRKRRIQKPSEGVLYNLECPSQQTQSTHTFTHSHTDARIKDEGWREIRAVITRTQIIRRPPSTISDAHPDRLFEHTHTSHKKRKCKE